MTTMTEKTDEKSGKNKPCFVIRPAVENDPGNADYTVTLLWRSPTAGEMIFGRLPVDVAASLLGEQNHVMAEGVDLPAAEVQRQLRIHKINGNQSLDTAWLLAADDIQLRTLSDNVLMRILREDQRAFWFEAGQPDWNLRRVEQLEFEANAARLVARMRSEEAIAARREYDAGRAVLADTRH